MSQFSHVLGKYRAADPSLTDGDVSQVRVDSAGRVLISGLAGTSPGDAAYINRKLTAELGNPTRITTATTTIPKFSPGGIVAIQVEVALTGTVTIYDNTAASGTIITILPIGTAAGVHRIPAVCGIGITIVTSAADRIVAYTI